MKKDLFTISIKIDFYNGTTIQGRRYFDDFVNIEIPVYDTYEMAQQTAESIMKGYEEKAARESSLYRRYKDGWTTVKINDDVIFDHKL